MKTLMSILVGALVCYGIRAEIGSFINVFVHTTDWQYMIPVWTELAIFLIPGVIVGVITPCHSMRNAVLAMFIGCMLIDFDILLRRHEYVFFNTHNVVFILLACFCGAISSCYGARLSGTVHRFFYKFLRFFASE